LKKNANIAKTSAINNKNNHTLCGIIARDGINLIFKILKSNLAQEILMGFKFSQKVQFIGMKNTWEILVIAGPLVVIFLMMICQTFVSFRNYVLLNVRKPLDVLITIGQKIFAT
jgi:hypothetical protein